MPAVRSIIARVDAVRLVVRGLGLQFRQVRSLLENLIANRDTTDQLVFTPEDYLRQTQETDHIAAVGMEAELWAGIGSPCLGLANLVRLVANMDVAHCQ